MYILELRFRDAGWIAFNFSVLSIHYQKEKKEYSQVQLPSA